MDHYEQLELSTTATIEAIECMFRYQSSRKIPEADPSSQEKLKSLAHSFNTLKDPVKRAAYDVTYQRNQQQKSVTQAESNSSDYEIRHRLLTIFYTQRRKNMKQPGLGITTVEEMMKIPPALIEFHIWYFKEKGWIQREVSGPYSITCAGVDEIELRAASRNPSPKTEAAPSAPKMPPTKTESSLTP